MQDREIDFTKTSSNFENLTEIRYLANKSMLEFRNKRPLVVKLRNWAKSQDWSVLNLELCPKSRAVSWIERNVLNLAKNPNEKTNFKDRESSSRSKINKNSKRNPSKRVFIEMLYVYFEYRMCERNSTLIFILWILPKNFRSMNYLSAKAEKLSFVNKRWVGKSGTHRFCFLCRKTCSVIVTP